MNNKKYFSAQDLLIQLEQINYMDVLNILTPFIVGYITNKAIDTYTLHREYKPKNIKKVNMPPELKFEYNNLDIDKIANTKIKESLKKFAEILIEKFKKEDLINFYNNINTLKTSSSNFKLHNFIL